MRNLHIWAMAPVRVMSLYSLYMLIGSVRLLYLNHTPKFLTVAGNFSKIWKPHCQLAQPTMFPLAS